MAALSQTVTVLSAEGLHARPCAVLAGLARRFACTIHLKKQTRSADVKSALDLMTLGPACGEQLILEVQGDDAAEALQVLVDQFNRNFPTGDVSRT